MPRLDRQIRFDLYMILVATASVAGWSRGIQRHACILLKEYHGPYSNLMTENEENMMQDERLNTALVAGNGQGLETCSPSTVTMSKGGQAP